MTEKKYYNAKPVRCIELNTIYPSAAEAARSLNLDPATIRKVCRGERKRTGGYHWEFVKEER